MLTGYSRGRSGGNSFKWGELVRGLLGFSAEVASRGGAARLVCITTPIKDAGKQPRVADFAEKCAVLGRAQLAKKIRAL